MIRVITPCTGMKSRLNPPSQSESKEDISECSAGLVEGLHSAVHMSGDTQLSGPDWTPHCELFCIIY